MLLSRVLRLTAAGIVGAGVLGFATTVTLGRLMPQKGAAEPPDHHQHHRVLQSSHPSVSAKEPQHPPGSGAEQPNPSNLGAGTPSAPESSAQPPSAPESSTPQLLPSDRETSAELPKLTITAAQPRTFVKTLSVARFARDTLDLCTDVTLEARLPASASADWEPPSLTQFTEAATKDGVLLRRTCPEQFSDRTALASCVATIERDQGRTKVHFAETYYNYSTVGTNDRYMRGCLNLSGDWQALSRQSLEYRKASIDACREAAVTIHR
jgi:hypothetical protein